MKPAVLRGVLNLRTVYISDVYAYVHGLRTTELRSEHGEAHQVRRHVPGVHTKADSG